MVNYIGRTDGDHVIQAVAVVQAQLENVAVGQALTENSQGQIIGLAHLERRVEVVSRRGVAPVRSIVILKQRHLGKWQYVCSLGSIVVDIRIGVHEHARRLDPKEAEGGLIKVSGFGRLLPRIYVDVYSERLPNAGLRFKRTVRNRYGRGLVFYVRH